MLKRLRALSTYRPGRPTARGALTHGLRLGTVFAKAGFWALCYHYFGSKALLSLVAAWAFFLGTKDLTFARVRLANMAQPEKRRKALVKSLSLEATLLAARCLLILAVSRILLHFDVRVAALLSGLMLCALFMSRETLITLTRSYGVTPISRFAPFLAAIAGLGAVMLFASWRMGPVDAAVGALVIREGVQFGGYLLAALIGATSTKFGRSSQAADDEEDDDSGPTVAVFGSDGKEIRSTFKIFIGDNVVFSRWRAIQFGSRFVVSGLLGPFGGAVSRLFFAYRRPGDYVHNDERMSFGKVVGLAALLLTMLGGGAFVAERTGHLAAFGIAVAGFLFRVCALSLNLLLWRRLSAYIGQDVPKLPRIGRR